MVSTPVCCAWRDTYVVAVCYPCLFYCMRFRLYGVEWNRLSFLHEVGRINVRSNFTAFKSMSVGDSALGGLSFSNVFVINEDIEFQFTLSYGYD